MAEASTRRPVAAVALWAIVMGATAFGSGCYGHNCEGDVQTFGRNEGEGRLLSADTWESSAYDGAWLAFPRQRVWIFDLTKLGNDRAPVEVIPYVSAQANPIAEQGNLTIAAGNLAEQSGIGNGQVVIKNGTCADYFLRLYVAAAPRPPSTSLPPSTNSDAGVDAGP